MLENGTPFFSLWAKSIQNSNTLLLNVSENELKELKKGNIITNLDVSTLENKTKQNLNFLIKGMHPNNCSTALRKLSLYEQFSTFLDFVKQSYYHEPSQVLTFHLDSPILPIPFILTFKLPRITKEGIYPFNFEIGMFKGLQGQIIIDEFDNRCIFLTSAHWEGPHTGFNETLIEVFASTLAKLGMEKLIRISRF
ncbi:MAG: hypothetical protein U0T83_06115 [Bacteriovoracaceae bacterium]